MGGARCGAIPRIVIAGTGSGVGKTTVACGLIGALRARGLEVQSFKVGPDYIDPSYHSLASSRPGRNLDAFLSGPELIAPLTLHGAAGAGVAVIEGVMGLFDGVSGEGELASTAHVAKLLQAPVVLVVDASKMARSVAAIVHGFRSFDPQLQLAGVVLNRVGSAHHEQILREAIAELDPPTLPVLGALPRDERLAAPERHLGLVPAAEIRTRACSALQLLAEALTAQMDLEGTMALARSAPPLPAGAWSAPEALAGARTATPAPAAGSPLPDLAPRLGEVPQGCRIALASGPAFSFHYRENLELLQAAGAELLEFDPLCDERLPEGAGALLLAGGFPEVYGDELAANSSLREDIAAFAGLRADGRKDGPGRPALAECGGLLFLGEELDGRPMCGVLPVQGRMTERLTLGYREAHAHAGTPWLPSGEAVRGHEFHYSQVEPSDGGERAAWKLTARGRERLEGFAVGAVQASFLHVHWAAHPAIAARFAEAAATSSAVAVV